MKLRMLGAFEVVRTEEVVTPSAPKLRQVLALLAMQANAAVSTRQLVDELWEEKPPPSSSTTLQTYIYQLRKIVVLGEQSPPQPMKAASLHTTLGGYLLSIAEDMIDVHQFDQLAAAGRRQLEDGMVEKAADTLRDALALWRGPALSDVSAGPVLQADIVRLEESRYSTLELRIDADLALERHHELISELSGYAAKHPTHEGLHARLMLALYRNGRRSEALQVFQRIRSVLAGELGLEPGPDLQRLHRAILASESAPRFGQEPTVVASPRHEPPAQLPPATPLLGREPAATELTRSLLARPAVRPLAATVCGEPGAGTSAFCVHVAHRVRHAFPDGQLYASLSGGKGPAEVLAMFLDALGTPADRIPDSLDKRTQLFRSITTNRRVLVVLDDAVHAETVLRLLPSGPECGALIGAHRRIYEPAIPHLVELPPLSQEQSFQLLAGAVGAARLNRDSTATRTLLEMCAGSPVALRGAANHLGMRPHWAIRHLIERMTQGRLTHGDLHNGDLQVAQSFRKRYQVLPPSLRAAFHTLAAHGYESLSIAEAALLLGVGRNAAESILENLVEFRLADVGNADYSTSAEDFQYRFHPLVLLGARLVAGEGGNASAVSTGGARHATAQGSRRPA